MPGYGGKQPGAGRPRGSRNRRTREAIAAAEQGVSPLDFLLGVMRDSSLDLGYRIEAAKAAAPYVHPKLSHVQVQATTDHRHLTDEQLDAEIAALLADPELRSLLPTTRG